MAQHFTTSLWVTAFGDAHCQNDQERTARHALLSALNTLENRIAPILERIPESCRGLTIHDISHVHQLWGVASQICGPDYPINPLEGFVLGAAFLIHDAGLTASVYPGSLDGLRATDYYKDRVSALLRSSTGETVLSEDAIKNAPSSILERALFDVLRAVHARRAETLLELSRPHPLTGQAYNLFPDPDLFLDCGEIIGRVAASHHWPLDKVDIEFTDPRTAPARFPRWSIDAVKLACILRTADACAIDERRARVMPFWLSDPKGVSRDHWYFQMNINPGARWSDSIVFHSKRPFPRAEMSSWWVAFDAIKIADEELRACDRLLRSRRASGKHPSLATLAAVRVEGANDPRELKDLIHVNGWTPVDTSVRIDNAIGLVEKLGGLHLYGDDFAAPLRELIQNGADAIRARRNRAAKLGIGFDGEVDISVHAQITHDRLIECALTISDDGIGMPEDVMTGALLDFGRSFWNTEEAATRYPGLVSDPGFQPTGRFGVGFYAVFMIADDVKVMSRCWDEGLNTIKTLHFRDGVRGRAELRAYDPTEDGRLDPRYSTVVRANISRLAWPISFCSMSTRFQEREIRDAAHLWELFERTARRLVFTLDVECYLSINGSIKKKLNHSNILNATAEDFATAYNETFHDEGEPSTFDDEEIFRIDSIVGESGIPHTRGVIARDSHSGGKIHIGGLTVLKSTDSVVKGIVAREPATAARVTGRRVAKPEQLRGWGTAQLEAVFAANVSLETKLACIANLVNIDVDVTKYAILNRDGTLCYVKDFVLELPERVNIFVALNRPNPPWPWSLTHLFGHHWGIDDFDEPQHDARIGSLNYAGADRYNQIAGSFDNPTNLNSGYAALIKALRTAGFELKFSAPSPVVIGKYRGPAGGHGRFLDKELTKGSNVEQYGIELSCERRS